MLSNIYRFNLSLFSTVLERGIIDDVESMMHSCLTCKYANNPLYLLEHLEWRFYGRSTLLDRRGFHLRDSRGKSRFLLWDHRATRADVQRILDTSATYPFWLHNFYFSLYLCHTFNLHFISTSKDSFRFRTHVIACWWIHEPFKPQRTTFPISHFLI